MIRHHDPFTANLQRLLRIVGALDAFDDERAPSANALPLFDNPRDLGPGMRFAMPHGTVDPLARVRGEVLGVFTHEHWVGGTHFVTDGTRVVEAALSYF